ncbi:hypothetical protein GVAV_002319 [Gurleya vavrai]
MRVPLIEIDEKKKKTVLKNRLAAQKTHQRKKEHVEFLEKQNNILMEMNKRLLDRIVFLENIVYKKDEKNKSSIDLICKNQTNFVNSHVENDFNNFVNTKSPNNKLIDNDLSINNKKDNNGTFINSEKDYKIDFLFKDSINHKIDNKEKQIENVFNIKDSSSSDSDSYSSTYLNTDNSIRTCESVHSTAQLS